MLKTVLITVTGKVQGVFYRQTAKEKATQLDIKGEVKNMPDETVQIIATGPKEQIEQLIEWCRRGPSRAKVQDIIVEEIPLQTFDKFIITR